MSAAELRLLRKLRDDVLKLADQWEEERFPGGLRNPQRIADAHTLRTLVDRDPR